MEISTSYDNGANYTALQGQMSGRVNAQSAEIKSLHKVGAGHDISLDKPVVTRSDERVRSNGMDSI
jgi:hypothetical protein